MYLVAAIHVILVEVGGIGFEFPLAPAPPSRPTVSWPNHQNSSRAGRRVLPPASSSFIVRSLLQNRGEWHEPSIPGFQPDLPAGAISRGASARLRNGIHGDFHAGSQFCITKKTRISKRAKVLDQTASRVQKEPRKTVILARSQSGNRIGCSIAARLLARKSSIHLWEAERLA